MIRQVISHVQQLFAGRRARQFDTGEAWANREIVYGRGYLYVEGVVSEDSSPFGQGARHALAMHEWIRGEVQREKTFATLEQAMLGRDVPDMA